MKTLSKPISSPGRVDKFPPPLLRFLRSNVGSRSTKSRSRSSPMFFIRTKKNPTSVIETTQEPSSPKVTCIGQVRVRRSKKPTSKKKTVKRRRFCWWLRKPVFCCKISPLFRVKWRPFRGFCGKWGSFFRFGYCKKVDATEDSFRIVSCNDNSNQKSEKTATLVVMSGNNNKFGGLIEENKKDSVDSCSSSTTPPKNAFLLTRCRSAPYRSSSLGGRFWGSPVKEELGNESEESEAKLEESENHTTTTTSSCESVVVEMEGSRTSEEESGKEMERLEDTSNKVVVVVEKDLKGMSAVVGCSVHPLLLTRCKSEPARTGERLVPEANFWKQRRSGVVEPCSSHHNS